MRNRIRENVRLACCSERHALVLRYKASLFIAVGVTTIASRGEKSRRATGAEVGEMRGLRPQQIVLHILETGNSRDTRSTQMTNEQTGEQSLFGRVGAAA